MIQSLFMAEISDSEFIFLDTNVYKSDTFKGESILDIQTHYKERKTFEYLNFHPCQAKGKYFVRGETQYPL